ncbi:uncharacterized protein DUF1835 [Algoriphagus ratkowskyi]|uniref:DUF1835 domain-containing protein n=1 Tax=Algoriphagus ratkowskyi TaxID=57028 RepID=A0A2W7RB21_9BACT|nr:DUF1835 domain-containing protein [Algoriphagus ratkowskyi]PZX57714.1 uncharacterized protein DUF1835 [Algoriphagus ratkowskyi]TXD78983.1 DUF1835 domain-containing protein [Algoriphagus ratkowskyi]
MLHILNGDSLAEAFPASIPGNIAVLRECLVDGPVAADSIEEFAIIRANYLSTTYPEATEKDYLAEVISEIEKILTATSATQVYLWFENDLFCQVNLWFVVDLLKSHKGQLYLISPTTDLIEGFGGMKEPQLEEAYRNAKALTQNERHVLVDMWDIYQRKDVSEGITLSKQVLPEIPFLYPAVLAWKESIPHGEYLGKPKEALKEIAAQLGTDDFGKIFRAFHVKYAIYGYGDLQVRRLWEEIKNEEMK